MQDKPSNLGNTFPGSSQVRTSVGVHTAGEGYQKVCFVFKQKRH